MMPKELMLILSSVMAAVATEPDEIKHGNVGESIIILQFNKSTTSYPRLYYNDQLVTVLRGDSCDISTNSRFYGRLRCENDTVENRYRIEIQNVALRDTGLYRVNTDGHDTERFFLNITDQTATVKGTTVTSRLNTVTIHNSSDGIYYSHLSTESLPSSDNTGILWSVLVYIIPIASGVVGVMMLMICCLVLIQRKNTHNLEAVQRLILEKWETESNALRSSPILPREEVRTDHLIHQSNTVYFPIMRHQFAAIPVDSPSVDTTYSRTEKLEADKHRLDVAEGIVNHSESSSQSTKDLAEACGKETEGLRKDFTSVCVLSFPEGDEAHYSRSIVDGRGQRQASESTEAWYAKVKKGPQFSPKNSRKTDDFGNDAYQMVDTSHANDHMNAFPGVEIDTVSTNIPMSPFQGTSSPRNDFAQGTKDDDGYETVENQINIRSAGNFKVSEDGDALNMQEEPKEQTTTPGSAENDYADINL